MFGIYLYIIHMYIYIYTLFSRRCKIAKCRESSFRVMVGQLDNMFNSFQTKTCIFFGEVEIILVGYSSF